MSMNDTLQNSFPDANTSAIVVEKLFQKITLGCILSSLSIFTVCGNILVLYAIQTEKHLRTVSNLFILSLAFADLAVGLFVMPLSAATIIAGRWPFSSVICKMWLSIDYVASTASIFNLVLLSLDRYWAVVYPLRYLRKRTRRRATIFILIVWFISLLWAPAVIFWSFIAPPQHSDIIKKDECDTSFRSNKTFKTLTALVNFYFPLLTMIIISCRIMVAIRSRSKMELGRRLSSSTQKQMKQDRTQTMSSLRTDNQTNLKSNDVDNRLSTPNVIANSSDLSIEEYKLISHKNSIVPTTEPGQCFCSTCQTYDGVNNESLWQLQQSPIKKSASSVPSRLSFAQIKPISMLFSSTKHKEENRNHINQNLCKSASDNVDMMRNSSSTTNNIKYSIIINPDEYSEKNDVPITKKKSPIKRPTSRTSSITSSFSDDYLETVIVNSRGKQKKSKPKRNSLLEKPTSSNHSPPTNCHLNVPKPTTKDSITTVTNNSSTNSPIDPTAKMNFFTFLNTLINPSHSSSLQKELKAARQLGMLVGVFTVSWLPYFILFLVVAWCNSCVSDTVYTASIWLGYLNSTFNPLIYPLCNAHFRRAFQKICYCQHAKTKLPNLNALRELQTLHTMSRRR